MRDINTITPGAGGVGIGTSTVAPFAPISVQNFGDIATAGFGAVGIAAVTVSPFSSIALPNSGDIATIGYAAIGISASAPSPFSPIAIINSGDIATLGVNAIGIQAATASPYAPIAIYNSGDIATKGQSAIGISANANSAVLINNSGDITTSANVSHGISASTGGDSPISIINSGMIEVAGSQSIGINAATSGSNSSIEITNSGGVSSGRQAILAYSGANSSPITIENSGDLVAQGGISATSYGGRSGITITNSAAVTSLGDSIAYSWSRQRSLGSQQWRSSRQCRSRHHRRWHLCADEPRQQPGHHHQPRRHLCRRRRHRRQDLWHAAAPGVSITPAVWVRGSGNCIGRDGTETTKRYGRTYEYDLRSDLSVEDFQTGIDFGKRDLLSQGDILVFGVLGGWVHGDVDFDGVNRQFDLSGGQAGAYATYLKGGLFVDTLFKADFLRQEQKTVEFPTALDATSFGVRTDTGYRFGSFRGGAFIEPLATIGVIWSDLEDFTLGGNHVNFDRDPNVRGRLGLRVGTSMPAWSGTTMEPFVIGSVWGNLSGEQTAAVTSNHATFNFEDSPEDVWGEMSAGVNFFNPSAGTSVFAKLDATFAENLEGFGGKAGMRVSWLAHGNSGSCSSPSVSSKPCIRLKFCSA